MSETEPLRHLLDGVRDGEPTRYQCNPDEQDPVCGETAADAWESFRKRGLTNPFHAVALQKKQTEKRTEQPCQNLECKNPVGNGTEDGRYCGLFCAMEAHDD